MTTCGWTGGTWAASVGACYDQVEVVDGPLICFAAIRDESKANARLIAASPQLYEALAELIDFAEPVLKNHGFGYMGKFEKARAALAAARGEG